MIMMLWRPEQNEPTFRARVESDAHRVRGDRDYVRRAHDDGDQWRTSPID